MGKNCMMKISIAVVIIYNFFATGAIYLQFFGAVFMLLPPFCQYLADDVLSRTACFSCQAIGRLPHTTEHMSGLCIGYSQPVAALVVANSKLS